MSFIKAYQLMWFIEIFPNYPGCALRSKAAHLPFDCIRLETIFFRVRSRAITAASNDPCELTALDIALMPNVNHALKSASYSV